MVNGVWWRFLTTIPPINPVLSYTSKARCIKQYIENMEEMEDYQYVNVTTTPSRVVDKEKLLVHYQLRKVTCKKNG